MSDSDLPRDLARSPVERRWSWIDDGLLPYALAALRALWVWLMLHLLYTSLLPGQGDMLSLGVVFGLLAGGTLASQVFVFRPEENRSSGWRQNGGTLPETRRAALIGGLVGLVAVLLALYVGPGRSVAPFWELRWLTVIRIQPGAMLLTVFPAALLWLWGILTGRERVYHETFLRNFALGLTALLAAMIFSYTARLLPTSEVVGVLTAFVAVGLVSLAIASLQETRRFEATRVDQGLPMARYWWGTVGTAVAGLLLFGLLLSQLFAPGTLEALANLFSRLLGLIGWLLSWVIFIIAYPILKLVEWLAQRINLAEGDTEMPPMRMPADLADQFAEMAEESAAGPGSQFPWWIVLAVIASAILFVIFMLAFRRFRTYAEDGEVDETRESILSLDLLKAQLAGWLRRRGVRGGPEPDPYARLVGEDPRMRVRRTYQALLAWAGARGVARQPGLTPEDYARVLASLYPAYDVQFAAITSAYCEARYSPLPLSTDQAEHVEAAWQQVAAQAPS